MLQPQVLHRGRQEAVWVPHIPVKTASPADLCWDRCPLPGGWYGSWLLAVPTQGPGALLCVLLPCATAQEDGHPGLTWAGRDAAALESLLTSKRTPWRVSRFMLVQIIALTRASSFSGVSVLHKELRLTSERGVTLTAVWPCGLEPAQTR